VAKTCDAVGKGRVSELNIPKLFLINFWTTPCCIHFSRQVVWKLQFSLLDQTKNCVSVGSFYTVAREAYTAFKRCKADQIIMLTAGEVEGFIRINSETRGSAVDIYAEYRAVADGMQQPRVDSCAESLIQQEAVHRRVPQDDRAAMGCRTKLRWLFITVNAGGVSYVMRFS
jgi:hypothetical protein